MRRLLILLILLICALITGFLHPPTTGIEIIRSEAKIFFPDEIEFSIEVEGETILEVVELEYGLDVSSCVTDVSRVIPDDFEPSLEVNTYWIWNMRRTGSLPPGARLWWRWHVVDGNGAEARTEKQWLTWIDNVHPWSIIQSGNLNLHWYSGDESFADKLLQSATQAQHRLENDIGTNVERDIHLYIYADVYDMRDAVLFEPGWTGGLAYADHAIVIIGIAEYELEWGLDTIAHELAHVIIGSAVDHCYSSLPNWLGEGLAVYAEGGLDPGSETLLVNAAAQDRLMSVRSLSDSFAEDSGQAVLSYAQSYSLVEYLVDTHGQESMLALLDAFQDGYRYDSALLKVYGFDADELDRRWREWIGAPPADIDTLARQATPTIFPTIQPYASSPSVVATDVPPPAEQTTRAEETGESAQEVSYLPWFIGITIASALAMIAFVGWMRRRVDTVSGGGSSG